MLRGADGRHEIRDLSVQAMMEGDFARLWTDGDNAKAVSTDTVKNVVNVVARENLGLGNEDFCAAVARRLLGQYPQIEAATVTAHETRWVRLAVDGAPHPHAFTLDGNGEPFARVVAKRGAADVVESGVSGFSFLKTTASGWAGYDTADPYTTLPETDDRIAATAMDATWLWREAPPDHEAANAAVLDAMLRVFATTYSRSIQDSLYRMGRAALEAVPQVERIATACPNKHYLLVDLDRFGLDNDLAVFTATDEPHGQIECVVGR